jgi:hypothetical protein
MAQDPPCFATPCEKIDFHFSRANYWTDKGKHRAEKCPRCIGPKRQGNGIGEPLNIKFQFVELGRWVEQFVSQHRYAEVILA